MNNRHNSLSSQEEKSPESPKNKEKAVDPSTVNIKKTSPASRHLMRKKYMMRKEASDLSIRERIDINEKSVEELKKFVE